MKGFPASGLLAVLASISLLGASPCCAPDTASGPAAFRAAEESKSAPEKELPAGQARVVIPVEGMTCGGCESAVKLSLKKLDGVVSTEADHTKGTATVTYEKEKVTLEKIVEAINKTGFKASLPGGRKDR